MKKLFLLLGILGFLGMNAQEPKQQPSINVTGEGTVKVVPDQVIIKSRIEHEGESAEVVKKQNDEAVDKMISFLKKQGIAEKNIRTDYMNLNKKYDYNDKTYSFVANQAISITLEDISNYEQIMKGLLENGLNRIDGIQFKSSEVDKYEAEARRKAVLDAREKARQFTEPLGQKVGKAISINEVNSDNFQPMYRMAEAAKMNDQGGETIAPGEMEIKVKVNISFSLE